MRYVVDASVGFKWPVVESLTDKARGLRDDYRNGIHELLTPDIFPIEVAHGLTRAERQGRIAVSQAAQFLNDLFVVLPVLVPSLPLLPRACEISSQMRIGIYDCLYVALAEREQCELITADARLVNVLRGGFPVVGLASLP